MNLGPGCHGLWSTPIGVYRLPGADELNPLLARMFGALRISQAQARGEPLNAPFFASDDGLSVLVAAPGAALRRPRRTHRRQLQRQRARRPPAATACMTTLPPEAVERRLALARGSAWTLMVVHAVSGSIALVGAVIGTARIVKTAPEIPR
ncbi:MAG: hypothetical protein Q8M01_02805 [Rubrivivax sp.]|nr:hypothetical protein [Rubrivivax sp.]